MTPMCQAHWLGLGDLAFMFAYHGLVPKLIALSPGEQLLLRAHGLEGAPWPSPGAGLAELALAALLLFAPRNNWSLAIAAVILVGLLVDIALVQPHS